MYTTRSLLWGHASMHKKVLFLFGPSGCGKGTQYALLRERLTGEIAYFSSGERLERLVRGGGRIARIVVDAKDRGLLVPQEIIQHLWSTFLDNETASASWIIFDGSPRFLSEARALRQKLQESPLLSCVHVLAFSSNNLDALKERMLLRRRSDDTVEKIARRFAWFANETLPVLDFFRDQADTYCVSEVDAFQTPQKVHEDICRILQI